MLPICHNKRKANPPDDAGAAATFARVTAMVGAFGQKIKPEQSIDEFVARRNIRKSELTVNEQIKVFFYAPSPALMRKFTNVINEITTLDVVETGVRKNVTTWEQSKHFRSCERYEHHGDDIDAWVTPFKIVEDDLNDREQAKVFYHLLPKD